MSKFRKPLLLSGMLLLLGQASVSNGADIEAGEKVFGVCKTCHAIGDKAKNKVGPQLNDVIGRKAGTADAYKYSTAMTKAGNEGLVWDKPTLKAYLAAPRTVVKGTKMAFAGLKKDEDLDNLIAFLATFSHDAKPASETPDKKAEKESAEQPQKVELAAAEVPAQADAKTESAPHFRLGRQATTAEIAAWDIDVRPDGVGLPEGKGTVLQGMEIFDNNCSTCHGDFGEAVGRWPVLAGGKDTLQAERPEKTIGSFWPYPSTIFDYVRRAMPFGNPRSLSNDDVYALTAYLLYLNDVVTDENFELSKQNFTDIKLPNEANFIEDDRLKEPHYVDKSDPCMKDCIPGKAQIKMHAAILDVTPEDAGKDDQPSSSSIE